MKKSKRVINITIAILGMVLYATFFVLAIIYFAPYLFFGSPPKENETVIFLYIFASFFLLFIYFYLFILVACFALFLLLLILSIKKRTLKGVIIAAIALCILFLVFCIPLLGNSNVAPYSALCSITLLLMIILCIISLRLGRNRSAPIQSQLPPDPPNPTSHTVEQKIAELKRLRDVYIISEEQFDQAVSIIIKNIT